MGSVRIPRWFNLKWIRLEQEKGEDSRENGIRGRTKGKEDSSRGKMASNVEVKAEELGKKHLCKLEETLRPNLQKRIRRTQIWILR